MLHVEVTGHGPDLVLVHGWGMHGGIFAPLTRSLSAHYTVHVVDLPGHGRSPLEAGFSVADCAARIAAQTPSARWVGWSLGGLVAIQAALDAPERVHALGLIATNPRFVLADDVADRWPHGVAHEVFAQFAHGLRQDWKRTLERFLALEAHGSDRAQAELRELKAQLYAHGEPTLGALEAGLQILDACDLRARLAEIVVPSLWIAGRRDRLVPPAAMRWAADACIQGRYLELPSGHAPFLAHADEITRALMQA